MSKPMPEFTLEWFLHSFDNTRMFSSAKTASEWLEYYEKAKASFDKYGLTGPPFGVTVRTLRPGFGGTGGDIRVLTRYDDYIGIKGGKYFLLTNPPGSHYCGKYISEVAKWWQDFEVVDDTFN